jgi:hypothetical protein
MWDSGAGSAAYGILYLYPGQPGQVRLAYGLELLGLQRVADTWYSSPWGRTPRAAHSEGAGHSAVAPAADGEGEAVLAGMFQGRLTP